ncbi:hypothetical protein ACH42_02130 [Endozoicomonas sp. (ex Bugula neritina AB1)]|nr:hypothetical protein ACH42_02130 [Endozoicomonas sp. (ex Bugula neritina AB1)]
MLLDTNNKFYKGTAVTTIVTTLVQSVQISFLSALFSLMPTPFDIALAVQLDELREKYDTANPYNNYRGTDLRDKVLNKDYKPTDRDYETEILEKYYATPPDDSKTYDFSKYDDGRSFDDKYSSGLQIANEVGANTHFPDTVGGHVNLNYHTKGAFLPEKNEDGSYTFVPNPEESDDIEPLSFSEAVSSEGSHSDTNINAAGDYGNQSGFENTASNELDYLSGGNTSNALAYQTLIDSFNQNPAPQVDPRDPLFDYGNSSLDDVRKGEGEWYQDCETRIIEEERTIHYPIWEEKSCVGPNRGNLSSCTIKRESNFPVKVIEYGGSVHEYNIRFVDDYTIQIEVGRDVANWLPSAGGSLCKVHTSKIVFAVDDGFTINKAIRSKGRYDDSAKIFLQGKEIERRALHTGDYSNFYWSLVPDENLELDRSRYADIPMDYSLYQQFIQGTANDNKPIHCEHHQGWFHGDVDLTDLVNSVDDGTITLEYVLGVGGLGDIHYLLTLTFDQVVDTSSIVHQNPPDCADSIGWTQDNNPKTCSPNNPICEKPYRKSGGFCKAEDWTCTDSGSKGWDQSILNTLNPLYPGDNHNVCWQANADSYQCDPLEGKDYCFYDHDGSKVCLDYEDIQQIPDECEEYRSDNLCFEKERECAEGWFDEANNACYMWEITYDCDVGPTETHIVYKEVNTCVGELPCAGGECDTGQEEESNSDFGKAAAYLDMLTYMNSDMACVNPSDPNTCEIFGGEPRYCSWELTGIGPDCCEKPDGVNVLDYIQLTNAMVKSEVYTKLPYYSDAAAYVQGGWSKVSGAAQGGFNKVWESIGTEITSPIESLFGSNSSGMMQESMEKLSIDNLKQKMMEYTYKLIDKIFPGAAENFITTSIGTSGATEYALSESAQLVANIIGYINYAYMAYMAVKLAINLLYGCDKEEQDMGIQIATNQCFKIGKSYCNDKILGVCMQKRQEWCCYSSVLSRIIMEQAYPMLGRDPDLSQCAGLSFDEMEIIDWDKIDLRDWIALATASGVLPSSSEMSNALSQGTSANEYINQIRLPHKGERLTTKDKVDTMVEDDEWSEARADNKDVLNPFEIDCSAWPRPAVCDLRDRPLDM